MTRAQATFMEIQRHRLWNKLKEMHSPISFDLEITARCNNNCRHCCINLPADDRSAQAEELSPDEISRLADEAVSLGAMWCLITGGEPLLRDDFPEIYLNLKRKGLLVSVFTNATLIRDDHIRLFQQYPPRDIEVTVYGVTRKTYERITRRAGSFAAFRDGLDRLKGCGVKVRLKAMALRSNLAELPAITRFCREHTKDFFRCDPLINLRYDGDERRNAHIRSERLSIEEIVAVEQADEERLRVLRGSCEGHIAEELGRGEGCDHLFHCGAGESSFTVSGDGRFRLCADLWHPECVYDLRKGTLTDAWENFVPEVRNRRSNRKEYLQHCHTCPIINLCFWCPARAHLETGEMDKPVDYFCRAAHAHASALGLTVQGQSL